MSLKDPNKTLEHVLSLFNSHAPSLRFSRGSHVSCFSLQPFHRILTVILPLFSLTSTIFSTMCSDDSWSCGIKETSKRMFVREFVKSIWIGKIEFNRFQFQTLVISSTTSAFSLLPLPPHVLSLSAFSFGLSRACGAKAKESEPASRFSMHDSFIDLFKPCW